MDVPDLVGLFIRPLEHLAIPYMITGGVASVIYGDPRLTRDIDLVLQLDPSEIDRFVAAFDAADFYVPPVETLQEEATRIRPGHFNVIHRESALRADIYLAGDDPFHAWAFERRRRLPMEDLAIWVAPLAYVVVRKLEYYRESGSDRHLRDVSLMLAISAGPADRAAIAPWVERLDLRREWLAAESRRAD